MLSLIKKSFANKTPVRIIYISDKGDITQRLITVKSLSGLKIKAFCHLRNTNRTFKIDNILAADPVKRKDYAS